MLDPSLQQPTLGCVWLTEYLICLICLHLQQQAHSYPIQELRKQTQVEAINQSRDGK